MGCVAGKVPAKPKRSSSRSSTAASDERDLLLGDEEAAKTPKRKSILVEASQKLKAKSGNPEVQKIIDLIENGEDFHVNRWRCLEMPDRAYYTLGPFAHLELHMVEARRLIPSVAGVVERNFGDEPDAFVRVYIDDCLQYGSRPVMNCRQPKWDDKQRFDIVSDHSFVRVHVYDTDSRDCMSSVDPLGFVEFCISDIPFDQEIDGWFELRFAQNLQGANLERYAMHAERREEELRFDTRELIGSGDKAQDSEEEDNDNQKSHDVDYWKREGKVPASLAHRVMKRVRGGLRAIQGGSLEDDSVQYNAGEIRLRLKLTQVVPGGLDGTFAKALHPSYFTYATFVQEEYLPQLDTQDLVDHATDIKILLLDDMLFALIAFCSYIVAWKSFLISGLLLAAVVACFISELLTVGILYFWMGLVLLIMAKERWRHEMTTNGLNASLDQEGLELVASWNDTSEMHSFLMRLVDAQSGQITGMQELVHLAGTVAVGRGELEITFDQLVEAMHDLWFIDMPQKPQVKKKSLVRVDKRKGTVTSVRGRNVWVEFDDDDSEKHKLPEVGAKADGVFDIDKVQLRTTPPAVPRMLVPRSLQGAVAQLQYHVNNFYADIVPWVQFLQDLMAWRKPVQMWFIILLVFGRSLLAFYSHFQPESWLHEMDAVFKSIRMFLVALVLISILFCKARGVRVVAGLASIAASYFYGRRAPDCWKFYKKADEPYRQPKIK